MSAFAFQAFAALFVLVSPLTVAPIYSALTAQLDRQAARSVAYRAVATATAILVLMAVVGNGVFSFFSISADSLRIVGGVIFFIMGYDMLNSRLPRTKHSDESTHEYTSDVAITPLGIPLLAGPGAITTVIVLAHDANGLGNLAIVFGALAAVMAITLAALLGAQWIGRHVGENGQRLGMRLIGLFEMAFGVEFFFKGLAPFVRAMLVN